MNEDVKFLKIPERIMDEMLAAAAKNGLTIDEYFAAQWNAVKGKPVVRVTNRNTYAAKARVKELVKHGTLTECEAWAADLFGQEVIAVGRTGKRHAIGVVSDFNIEAVV